MLATGVVPRLPVLLPGLLQIHSCQELPQVEKSQSSRKHYTPKYKFIIRDTNEHQMKRGIEQGLEGS